MATISNTSPLIDRHGRTHTSLRISVTDRCNVRCLYCMPHEHVEFRTHAEILRYEEITRFVRVLTQMGVRRLRLTGGEPLVRAELPRLVEQLAVVPGVDDLALTTNGILLAGQAEALRRAGLRRVNISLDTLREKTFEQICRCRALDRVLAGIDAAQQAGFEAVRLNAVVIRGLTDADIVPLARFARRRGLVLRFIEFMPLDGDRRWRINQVLDGSTIRRVLEDEFGPLVPVERTDCSRPAVEYEFADGGGRIGLLNPVSQPFCEDCDRLRLTAEGQVRNCLFSTVEWDARAVLRGRGSDDQLAGLVRDCAWAKTPVRGTNSEDFARPARAMHQIGG
jgi:cyclic pyranopterin phosphate synthase